jgi:hypothetical protein
MLKTHYREFHSPFGVDGLAKELNGGKHLDVLAFYIPPHRQGQGRLRTFITEAKKQYTEISVWEIGNPVLESALTRYGFEPATKQEWDRINKRHETVTGMVWKKKAK